MFLGFVGAGLASSLDENRLIWDKTCASPPLIYNHSPKLISPKGIDNHQESKYTWISVRSESRRRPRRNTASRRSSFWFYILRHKPNTFVTEITATSHNKISLSANYLNIQNKLFYSHSNTIGFNVWRNPISDRFHIIRGIPHRHADTSIGNHFHIIKIITDR